MIFFLLNFFVCLILCFISFLVVIQIYRKNIFLINIKFNQKILITYYVKFVFKIILNYKKMCNIKFLITNDF